MNYYKCGQIMTTHGIKGDLKIRDLSDSDRFYKGSILYIYHNGEYIQVKVRKVSEFGNAILVGFENLEDINLVEKYHSDFIYVSEADREVLGDNEFYYSDLIGKNVVNENDEARGVVVDVRELPQSHYLYVEYNDKKCLVPFIDEFILDVTKDKIIVKEIEGLF